MSNIKQITEKEMNDMNIETIKITGKIKQSKYNEYELINKGMVKAYGKPMYDLSEATIDFGSVVDQLLVVSKTEPQKLSKSQKALVEVIEAHGTQYPIELNGTKYIIRINGASAS